MSLPETIRFAGDVNIENISVVTSRGMTQNITNQVINIEIYEDLFSPFMTGLVTVRDSLDFVNLLPFIGEEFLDVSIHTPTLEKKYHINQQFYIFKISDRMISGDRTAFYQLFICSKEMIADANKQISKVYSGLVSDIAKELITSLPHGLESKKNLIIEPTVNRTKFIANYWSPVRSLNYAAGTAITKRGGSNYVFFENRDGINFVSMEFLYDRGVYQEFVYDNYSRDVLGDGRAVFNLNKDYSRIIDYDTPYLSDYLEKARSGMFASKLISNDVVTKKYYSKNYTIKDDYDKTYHLNEHSPFTESNINSPNSMIIKLPKELNVFNGYSDVSNVRTIQRRISQLTAAQNNKLTITVLGRTDYTVGMKVRVNLNKIEPIKKEDLPQEIIDKILSGNYIVSAINHRINRQRHECHMELIKDSYIMDLNEGK